MKSGKDQGLAVSPVWNDVMLNPASISCNFNILNPYLIVACNLSLAILYPSSDLCMCMCISLSPAFSVLT